MQLAEHRRFGKTAAVRGLPTGPAEPRDRPGRDGTAWVAPGGRRPKALTPFLDPASRTAPPGHHGVGRLPAMGMGNAIGSVAGDPAT